MGLGCVLLHTGKLLLSPFNAGGTLSSRGDLSFAQPALSKVVRKAGPLLTHACGSSAPPLTLHYTVSPAKL